MRARLMLPLVLLFTATACGDDPADPDTPLTEVAVADDLFSPSAATVALGGTVRWTWEGSHQHNVTWVGTTPASATQASGTYERTFTTPGPYQYYCTIHGTPGSGMRGTVTVQ